MMSFGDRQRNSSNNDLAIATSALYLNTYSVVYTIQLSTEQNNMYICLVQEQTLMYKNSCLFQQLIKVLSTSQ